MRILTTTLLTIGLMIAATGCGNDETKAHLDAAKEAASEAGESAKQAAKEAGAAAEDAAMAAKDATQEAVDQGVAAAEGAKQEMAAAGAGADSVAQCRKLSGAEDWAAALAPCTLAHELMPDDLAITHAFQQAQAAANP